MSITDELRRYAANWEGWFYDDKDGGLIHTIGHDPVQSTPVPKVINAIANRIDIEHARAVMSGMNDALYHANDECMAELGWLRLPNDADGVSIHIGDTMEWLDGSTAEVIGIGNGVFFYKDDESDGADWSSAENKHHVKPDSWERIIEDAISECGWEQPKEYEIDFEDSKEQRDRFVAELVERCKRLAGE